MMDISTPKAVLIAAKGRIDTKETWGQGSFKNPDTGCLCALGAIIMVTGIATVEELNILADPFSEDADDIAGRIIPLLNAMPAVKLLADAIDDDIDDGFYTIPIWEFNDGAVHRDVMELFDEAIAKA